MKAELIPATIADYPRIQRMAGLYVYDMSRYCGFLSEEWRFPEEGAYESFDFKNYFIDEDREAYLVRVNGELAGFVLLNQILQRAESGWNVGEFFIIAKFQGRGVGRSIAHQLFDQHPGNWELTVIPENTSALAFWRKTIASYTNDYTEAEITVDFAKIQPQRMLFEFLTIKS